MSTGHLMPNPLFSEVRAFVQIGALSGLSLLLPLALVTGCLPCGLSRAVAEGSHGLGTWITSAAVGYILTC